MAALRSRLPRPSPASTPTNIRLPEPLKVRAAQLAVDRYQWSLTRMIREYLQWETSHKRGIGGLIKKEK